MWIFVTVLPSQIIFTLPFPGIFFGVSTRPDCLGGIEALICDINSIILTDKVLGYNGGSILPSEFLAWSKSSGIIIKCTTGRCVTIVNLYYYHDPAYRLGLPELHLSASKFPTQLGDPLNFVIIWNPVISMTSESPGVRNITLFVTKQIEENIQYLHIAFWLTGRIQQFAVSELNSYHSNGKP